MFKCTKCGKGFDYLYAYATEHNCYYFDTRGDYELKNTYTAEIEYGCPGCGETLTMDEGEAKRLLEPASGDGEASLENK